MTSESRQPDTAAPVSSSLLHRLSKTPLRDLLRGRLTARLDIHALLTQSALPHDIQSLIQRVTRRTRLWRIEKADVAKELIAHFRDALATSGSSISPGDSSAAAITPATVKRLLTDFGNEQQAAKLIRRAKRRNRPFVWHAWRRSLQAVGGLTLFLILTYAYVAVRYWTGKPKITHDYLADLNAAALVVPKDQAAWPIYREAMLSLTIGPEWWKQNNNFDWMPDEPRWEENERILRENDRAIATIRQAAAMPAMGYVARFGVDDADRPLLPPDPRPNASFSSAVDGSVFSILLPHLLPVRQAATLLVADARSAAATRDSARVVADLRAVLAAARQVREIPTLIVDMVALSIIAKANSEVLRILATDPSVLSEQDWRALAHELAAAPVKIRFDGERSGFLDVLQRSFTDDGAGDGRMTPDGLYVAASVAPMTGGAILDGTLGRVLAPAGGAISAGRRDLLREYERLFGMLQTQAALPLWRRGSPVQFEVEKFQTRPASIRYWILGVLLPAWDRCLTNSDLLTQERDVALTAIALELFHRAHNTYPASLQELVPALLSAVPPDQYDGKPIKYKLAEYGKPLLYSIGNDRTDDGGRLCVNKDGIPSNDLTRIWYPLLDERGKPHPRIWRGYDWILYPPVRTPPPPSPPAEVESVPQPEAANTR